MRARTQLVLFDLDGTLVDTAPDLAAAANRMRALRDLAPLPLAQLRPLASQGARGLLRLALEVTPASAGYEALRDEFLANYERALCVDSRLFDGMDATLAALEERGVQWGIVTNKSARFTDPLVAALGLAARAACVVSGDTTPHPKPHPAPLLFALEVRGISAAAALYVGDDRRDIEAGRAAALRTVAAAYGYLGDGGPIDTWGADHCIDEPAHLLALL